MLFLHQIPSSHPSRRFRVRVNAVVGQMVVDCGATLVLASVNGIASLMRMMSERRIRFSG